MNKLRFLSASWILKALVSLKLIPFFFLLAYSVTASAIYDKTTCVDHQMLLASDKAQENWYLYICDQSGNPRGFSKSELTALYNATMSKPPTRDQVIFWAKVMGVDPKLSTDKMIAGILAEFKAMDPYLDQVMLDKFENKDILVELAKLYKTHINKSEPPTMEPPFSTIAEGDHEKLAYYRAELTGRITKLCERQGAQQTMALNGENNCVCGKTYFTDFHSWKCNKGKIESTTPGTAAPGTPGTSNPVGSKR